MKELVSLSVTTHLIRILDSNPGYWALMEACGISRNLPGINVPADLKRSVLA